MRFEQNFSIIAGFTLREFSTGRRSKSSPVAHGYNKKKCSTCLDNPAALRASRLQQIIPLFRNHFAVLEQLQVQLCRASLLLQLQMCKHAPAAGFGVGNNE